MRNSDVPVVGRPPDIRHLRVSGGPESTTSPSATSGGDVDKTAGRTEATSDPTIYIYNIPKSTD